MKKREPPSAIRDLQMDKQPFGDMVIPVSTVRGLPTWEGIPSEGRFVLLPIHCSYSCGHPYLLASNGVN
jgi:hypothetical protein